MQNKLPKSPLQTSLFFALGGMVLVFGLNYGADKIKPPPATAAYLQTIIAFALIFSATFVLFLILRRQAQKLAAETTARQAAERSLRLNLEQSQNLSGHLTAAYMRCQLLYQDSQPVDYRFLEVNPAFKKLTALNPVPGQLASESQPPLTPFPDLLATFGRVALTRQPEQLEYQSPPSHRIFALTIFAHEPGHFAVIFDDITRHKQAEHTWREESACFAALLKASPSGITITRQRDGLILNANGAFARLHGYSPDELISHTPAELGLWNEPATRENFLKTLHQQGGCAELVINCRRKNGQTFAATVSAEPIEMNGEACFLSVWHELIHQCLEFLPLPIGIADHQGKVLYCNQVFTETYGYTKTDIPTIDHWARHAYPDPDLRTQYQLQWSTDVEQSLRAGTPTPPRSYQVTCHDRSQRQVEITMRPTGKFLIAIFNDLTDRIKSENLLRKFSHAVEQSPVAIFITDTEGQIEYINPRFTLLTGYQSAEVIGKNPRFLKSSETPRETYQHLWQTIKAGKDWHGELQNRKKNGELYWEKSFISPIFDSTSKITHFLALKEDISAQKQLEHQLRQSQKMEAMGMLASGVAHDFNNVLTVIHGHAELMVRLEMEQKEYREYALQITAAAERAANLTRQLLMFSRKQNLKLVSLDLNHTVAQMTKMLQRILGEDITLTSQYVASLPPIKGDAGMIEQIIMNLAVNARDALPHGGQLTISTRLDHFEDDEHRPAVCLSVSDNGCGIPPENLPHIFEPFFTTKETGKGTGLGLPTVYSIVQQHHGKIKVISQPELGTTFHLTFPVLVTPTTGTTPPASTRLPRGTETILVVEDEAPVRLFVSRLLERCGYRIFRAENGLDALVIWEQQKQHIHLLLTDIIMPGGLNGYELAGRLLAEKPDLKVIYTSGYTGDFSGKRSTLIEGKNFLQKPYPPQRLAEILRQTLNAK
jgi:PAS domain S-box-containing protein